jgi:branched-chain amino acid transport system permease protein
MAPFPNSYKSSGIFNFAQGEFGTVAVFALWGAHSVGVPYGFAMLLGLAAALASGLATERFVVRPLFGAPRVTLLVATAGVSLFAIGVERWLGENQLRFLPPALGGLDRVSVFGFAVSDQRLLIIATLLALAVIGALFFARTDLGLAILGLSQNPLATELMGISAERLSRFTWGVAALLGGLGGILSAPLASGFGAGFVTLSALIPAFTALASSGLAGCSLSFPEPPTVGSAAILSTTSMPSMTLPNTVYLLSSVRWVSGSVSSTIKNCEPALLSSLPFLAIDTMPRSWDMLLNSSFIV